VSERSFSEEELASIERAADPRSVTELVRNLREHQRQLDSLRMSMDVARRDREELRSALLRCQEELRRARGE
jgi:hypothetical protein